MRKTVLTVSILNKSFFLFQKTAIRRSASNIIQPALRGLKTLVFSYLFIAGAALADGSISGNVTDSDTLAAIPTMLVCLFDEDSVNSGCMQSDVNGDYTTPVVADGAYFVLAIVGHSFYIQEFHDGVYHFEDHALPATVEVAGSNVTGIDFQLEKGPTIEGTVTDRAGATPLQGVRVCIYRSDGTPTKVCSTTAVDGHYRTGGFPVEGTDFIAKAQAASMGYLEVHFPDAACIDYYCNLAEAEPLSVGPAGVSLIDFELEAFANVSGKIVDDADGTTAVHPVAISLVHPGTGEIFDASGTTQNNPDGSYSFTNIAPGEYKLFFNAYDAADNYVDELYSNIPCPNGSCDINGLGSTKEFFSGANPFGEELVAGALLSGTIVDAADGTTPVYPVYISFIDPVSGADVGGGTNNPDGTYTIGAVEPGEYKFFFNAINEANHYIDELYDEVTPCDNGGCDFIGLGSTLVLVAGNNNLDEDLAVTPTISGTVTAEVGGALLEGIQVCASRKSDERRLACNLTDGTGFYQLTIDEPSNDLVVWTRRMNHQPYFAEVYADQTCCDISVGTSIDVTGGDQVVNLMLTRSASISGVVSSSAGDGSLPNGTGRVRLYSVIDGVQAQGAIVNADGSYVLSGFEPGTYYLLLTGYEDNLIHELYDGADGIYCPHLSCDTTSGTQFVFSGIEDIINIDAVLDPGSQISGYVSKDGAPLDLIFIDLYTEAGVYAGFGRTSNDGSGNYVSNAGYPAGNYYASNRWVQNGTETGNEAYLPVAYPNRYCGTPCDATVGDPFIADGSATVPNIDFEFEDFVSFPIISGTVTAEAGGALLGGIQICASRKSDELRLACNLTDGTGFYHLIIDQPSDDLVVWTRRLNDQPYFAEMYADQVCCDFSIGTSIDVTGGDQVVNLMLTRSASISGVISSSFGDFSLPSGTGRARLYSVVDGVQAGRAAIVNADGSYILTGIEPGTYYLLLTGYGDNLIDELYDGADGIYCPQLSCDTASGHPFVVSGTEDIINIDAVLDPGSQFSGHVSKDGTPLDLIFINFYTEAGVYAGFGRTSNDGSGNYVSNAGYPAGNYYASNRWVQNGTESGNEDYLPVAYPNRLCGIPCDATVGDLLVADGSTTIPDIDFEFEDYGASITGNITGSDTLLAIENISLWLFDTECNFIAGSTTDINGNYKVTVPSAGSYYLFAIANETIFINKQTIYMNQQYPGINMFDSCYPPLNDVTQGEVIVVAELEQATGKDFVLEPGGTISGSISDSNGLLANNTAGARLYGLDGTLHIVSRNKEGDDSYRIGGILPGSYHVVLAGYDQALIDERYDDEKCPRNSCASNLGVVFEVVTGAEDFPAVDAVLDVGSVISGNVQIDGVPLASGAIYFYNAVGDFAGFGSISNGNYQSTSGFPAGSYYVVLETDGYVKTVYPNRPCGDPCDPTIGDPVVLDGTNDVGGIDFNSYAGSVDTAVIYGSVIADDGGAALDDVKICVVNKSDQGIDACMVTGASGTYLIGGLPKMGDYVVYTRDVGGNAVFAEVHDSLSCCDTSAGTSIDLTSSDASIDFGLATSGRIHGTVTDSVTGEGVPYVEMFLFDADGNQVNNIRSETADDPSFLGQYVFTGVPDGTFYVFAQSELQGYANELYPDLKRFRVQTYGPISDGQAIVVQNGTLVDGIDFELDPAGSINGTVSDINGVLPFNKARIRLYATGDRTPLLQFGNWNEDSTYTIPGVPPGSYDVILTSIRTTLIAERFDDIPCPRNSCDLGLGTPVVVGPQEQVFDIDAVLEEGAQIAGIITDAGTGDGVAQFCMAFYTVEGLYAALGCTDQDGNYVTTTGLPPGEYRAANQFFSNDIAGGWLPQVWTEDGSFVGCGVPCNFTAGDTFTITGTTFSTPVNMAMQQGSTISGNVQFEGAPIEAVDVVLLGLSGGAVFSVKTDASGDYEFNGIPSGEYPIRTLNDFGHLDKLHDVPTDITCNPHCNPYLGTLLTVDGASNLGGIDFTLEVSGTISGTVTDTTPIPITGITVDAYNILGNWVSTTVTNAAGEYTVKGLGDGGYFVGTRNSLGYRDGLYDAFACPPGCDVRVGIVIAVNSGADITGIDFELSGGATISGRITGPAPDNTALAGTVVEIYSEVGNLAATVVADGNGDYLADGLAAGNYHVVTRVVSTQYLDQAANGSICQANCNPLLTPTITVADLEDFQLDFQLARGATIVASIKSHSSGVWLSAVPLVAVDSNGVEIGRAVSAGIPHWSTVGNLEVNVEISGLPPGDVYLYTQGGPGFTDEVFDGISCQVACDPLQGTKTTILADEEVFRQISLQTGYSISGLLHIAGTGGLSWDARHIEILGTHGSIIKGWSIGFQDGSWTVSGLWAGSYRVKAYGPGLVAQYYGGDSCTPEPCLRESGTVINIVDSDVTGIDVTLERAASMTGNAYDSEGNAVELGLASLYSSTGAFLMRSTIGTLVSNEVINWVFHFPDLAEGTYYVLMKPGSSSSSTEFVETLHSGILCPGASCDVTTGTPVVMSTAEGSGSAPPNTFISVMLSEAGEVPEDQFLTIEPERGFNLRGSLKNYLDEPIKLTKVYFFTSAGEYAGEATTDGLGSFVTSSALPNGNYFAATSRAVIPEDTAEEAIDAENGAVEGLQDQAWSGFACDGICAPSQGSSFGTPIVVNGADVDGIDIVLSRAPGIEVEKHTNGVDADTPNGGDAPEISAGETVSWTYEVTNTGGVELVNIAVVDDQAVVITCPFAILASDAFMICTGSEPAKNLSLGPFTGVIGNCAGTPDTRLYQNTATVTAETGGGMDVDDTDSSHYCNPVPKEELIFNSGFE